MIGFLFVPGFWPFVFAGTVVEASRNGSWAPNLHRRGSFEARSCFPKEHWKRMYMHRCCVTVEGWEGCCCVSLDFDELLEDMLIYLPALAYTPSSRIRAQMPQVSIASVHMASQCFHSQGSWLASPSPLGVLALHLFFLSAELDEALRGQASPGQMEFAVRTLPLAYMRLRTALTRVSPRTIYESRWPIFTLVWIVSRLLFRLEQTPAEVVLERERLLQDTGSGGQFFRLLWSFVDVTDHTAVSAALGGLQDRLFTLIPEVPASMRPVAELAVAVWRHHRVNSTCTAGVPDPYDAVRAVIHTFRFGFFHVFPTVELLDRLSMPAAVRVEHGVAICLPMARATRLEMDSIKAARVQATRSSGCQRFVRRLLKGRNVTRFVDVGAQFGACTAVAARIFPRVKFLAYEPVEANIELIRRTSEANKFSNLQAQRLRLVSNLRECQDDKACSTLDNEYPFDAADPQAAAGSAVTYAERLTGDVATATADGAGGGAWAAPMQKTLPQRRFGGVVIWIAQLAEMIHPILEGAQELIKNQLVDTVAVFHGEASTVRHHFGPAWQLEEEWSVTDTGKSRYQLLIATRKHVAK